MCIAINNMVSLSMISFREKVIKVRQQRETQINMNQEERIIGLHK